MKPSDAFLLAKRQITEAIDSRLEVLKESSDDNKEAIAITEELEKLRSYVKNVMLWKNRDGK